MAGKQAKILTRQQVRVALNRARRGRYPQRDRVMILLSVKAGLRAGEIAKLRWSMVLDADGRLGRRIELHDSAAKKAAAGRYPSAAICAARCSNSAGIPEPRVRSSARSAEDHEACGRAAS